MVKPPHDPAPNPLAGAIAGLAAGLAASFAMSQAQALMTRAGFGPDESDDDPATVKAADAVARASTGRPIEGDDRRETAGTAVHYATGALLGLAYGIAAEYRPETTSGGGTAFGLSTSLLLDEAAVPALGLGDAPQDVPLATHVYGLAAHLVFGVTAEATRRGVRQLFD